MSQRSIYWHKTVNRPITNADVGRFVVGRSRSHWMAGHVVESHAGSGPLIDTQYLRNPSAQHFCATSIRIYAFMNGPSPSLYDLAKDPTAEVVQFRA